MSLPLTRLAHGRLQAHLQPGDLALDATAGNGHDTLFLARQVGEQGRVFAFDIQAQAIAQTRERLASAGLASRVTLIQAGHERLKEWIPPRDQGRFAAAMFNLGYLPGSDKTLVTRIDTTLAALQQAIQVLAPGGLLSVLAYRGHPGGLEESQAVAAYLETLTGFRLEITDSPGPILFTLDKEAGKMNTMPKVIIDPASRSLDQRFAVVHTRRRSRERFPEGCVTLVQSEAEAIAAADPEQQRYGAIVYGPSKSSEGLRLYYLVRWLT